MSVVIDIADAVAAELNAAPAETFEPTIAAQRRTVPAFELSELADLKVTVVPRSVEITGATRSASQYEIGVDIGVQQKVSKDLDADVVALISLVDQIGDYLRRRPLSQAPYASWVGIANEPVYVPEHLTEQRTFTSVLTATYRLLR